MVSIDKAKTEPREQLWDEIEKSRAVMLGIPSSGQHLQPMAPQPDREDGAIWFYTNKRTDLVGAVHQGGEAVLILVSDDEDYHASLTGTLTEHLDREKVEKHWNSVVAAWFQKGKDDPDLTMLAFRPKEGAIWASTDSTLKFGWEIARANLSEEKIPDVGYHTIIPL